MKLLLHICCAHCLIYPLQWLRSQGAEVTGYFYNPNIHPLAEYKKRKQALSEYTDTMNCQVEYVKGYDLESFFQTINTQSAEPGRCLGCYQLRLKNTAEEAKKNGFEAYTTTLLVSPYQRHEELRQIGKEIGQQTGVRFLYHDFREGWSQAFEESKTLKLYRQKYCGCLYSERKRYGYARD